MSSPLECLKSFIFTIFMRKYIYGVSQKCFNGSLQLQATGIFLFEPTVAVENGEVTFLDLLLD